MSCPFCTCGYIIVTRPTKLYACGTVSIAKPCKACCGTGKHIPNLTPDGKAAAAGAH